MKPRISQLAKASRGHQTACALRARQDYKVAALGIKVKISVVFSVTPFKIDQNKNQNRSILKVQNPSHQYF